MKDRSVWELYSDFYNSMSSASSAVANNSEEARTHADTARRDYLILKRIGAEGTVSLRACLNILEKKLRLEVTGKDDSK